MKCFVTFGSVTGITLAAPFGVSGLGLISQAPDALTLGAGVFACGICTGLMMPALSAGIESAVQPRLHGRVTAVMNAGTSAGVAISVPAVLLLADAWRTAYLCFAVLAAVGLVAAWRYVPTASQSRKSSGHTHPPITPAQRSALCRLVAFGFGMGMVSAAYWVFAPDLAVAEGGMVPGRPSLGPVLPFLSIAIGQAVGSFLVGLAVDGFGYTATFLAFAALGVVIAASSSLLRERTIADSAQADEIIEFDVSKIGPGCRMVKVVASEEAERLIPRKAS